MQPPLSTMDERVTGEFGEPSRLRRGWVLFLMSCVAFFYMLDRNALIITQELIKNEFALSDTQIGLLAGAAYGIPYALAGLPLGMLIDRANRKNLLGAIVALWSAFTAVCGIAGNFAVLVIARMGIGVAEAGGQPAAFSIMSDVFPPQRRSSATGIYMAGAATGAVVAAAAGGYLAATYGWRAVFLVYGIPGIILGLLLIFTLREPVRHDAPASADAPRANMFKAAWAVLTTPRLVLIYAALAVTSTAANGLNAWQFAYLIRVRQWSLHEVGLLGAFMGLFSVAGMILLGIAGDRARRRSRGGPAYLAAMACLVTLGGAVAWLFLDQAAAITAGFVAMGFFIGTYGTASNVVVAEFAPAGSRGLAFSVATVSTNLVGATLGPTLIGVVSDLVQVHLPQFNPLRTAILAIGALLIPCALLYLAAGRRIDRRE